MAPVDFAVNGQLKDFQLQAIGAMAARDFGVLAASTGSGKTVMALALIARRQQPAMVVVHTRELMKQWISRIENFLGIPAGQVGRIGGKSRSSATRSVWPWCNRCTKWRMMLLPRSATWW